VDLRLGSVSVDRSEPLSTVSSADGSAVYALTRAGELTRFTPSGGDWKFHPPLPASALFAQTDGSLIVAGALQAGKNDTRVIVWRVRPPGQAVSDSLSFEVGGTARAVAQQLAATAGTVGDRVYFGANESVIVVRSRDLTTALEIDLGDPVRAIAATPSGDRLFVALDEQNAVRVIDRFEEGLSGKIKLPSPPLDLRMDPLGRALLARGAGDTVYVVSLASDEVQGVVQSVWRGDLPLVLPDGAIAAARGDNVVFANPATLADGRSIAGGAKDLWYALRWNGFRPRAAGLDQPVQFRTSAPRDPSDVSDTASAGDSTGGAPPPRPDPSGNPSPLPRADSGAGTVFTVSFAAVLEEKQARGLASRIRVDGERPRITTSERAGKTLYRVVMGPYATRDEAERVGRASAQSYWIFRGAP
jgi:cell division septation protein DedD